MASDKSNKKNKGAKPGSNGKPEAAAAAAGSPEQAADETTTSAPTPVETDAETSAAPETAEKSETSSEASTDAGTAEEAVEVLDEIIAEVASEAEEVVQLSEEDEAILDAAATDLVADMRSDMLRAQAELVNFRTRVERDRVANREAVIAEVIRSILPALDDLNRAEKHGDLVGSPLEIVATKIRASFERYGLRSVGTTGELFDPHFHEAVVQLPTPGATDQTVADVIEPGYALGERLIRAAKVAVSVPE
ncbi:MAG: molecular chaperone GrpE [Microbacteriaceae bacterium]|nr:molecular chaperone GrpE [Microbacteriaceae bacterium]